MCGGEQADFPYAATLSAPLRVQLKDVYGFGVTGRGSGIAIYVQRVQDALTLQEVKDFKNQWSDLSYIDRLSNLFSLVVQGEACSSSPCYSMGVGYLLVTCCLLAAWLSCWNVCLRFCAACLIVCSLCRCSTAVACVPSRCQRGRSSRDHRGRCDHPSSLSPMCPLQVGRLAQGIHCGLP